jgi:Holliday junction DNA helicase RuvB
MAEPDPVVEDHARGTAADGPTVPASAEQVSANKIAGDTELDTALRPRTLADFLGQPKVTEQLALVLAGASGRGAAADHVLFSGPPGLGKTSLAEIVAAEMGADLRATSGPALERPGDLAAILTNLEPGDVLFVDEVHRLPRAVEEVLYPAMEQLRLDIVVGKGPEARALRLPLPGFTLVGATTRTGLMTAPLRDRFGFAARLEYYDAAELESIVARSAELLAVRLEPGGCTEIARRSRGTPRVANRLLKRVRDYAEVRADGVITESVACAGLDLFDIDGGGLDALDRRVLEAVTVDFSGGPVGLSTLAVAAGEETDTVADTVEPFLIQRGLLARTARGRVATAEAYRHLGLEPPVATHPLPGGDGAPEGLGGEEPRLLD